MIKRKKLVALFSIMALSVSSVTPALAQDSVSDDAVQEEVVQEETVTEDVPENVTEEVELSEEATAEEEETKAEQTIEETESEDPAVVSDGGTDVGIPETGWYEEDGYRYYYVDGVMLEDTMYQIEGDWYYFWSGGTLMVNGDVYYWNEDTEKGGYIRSAEDGILITGWYYDEYEEEYQYYGEDFFRYESEVLEEDGNSYYFNTNGYLVRNGNVLIDDVLYYADEDGVLTVVDDADLNGWQMINGAWYYFEDGSYVCDEIKNIDGKDYYFDWNGELQTGTIWTGGERPYLTDSNGAIIKHAKGWYQSPETKYWYYFLEDNQIVTGEIVTDKGKQYYFDWEGIMQTGSFVVSIWNEEEEDYDDVWLLADPDGVIMQKTGWVQTGGEWYYIGEDGNLYTDGLYEIGGKKYLFNYAGVMDQGMCWYDGEVYMTDAKGALVMNDWVRFGLSWYRTDEQGRILTEQWVDNHKYYVDWDGEMVTGVYEIEGESYLFADNGALVKKLGAKAGWELADGTWYYRTEDGEPYSGWLQDRYYIMNGAMATNMIVDSDDGCYYVGYDGEIMKGWIKTLYGEWFYADSATGKLITDEGWKLINGKWYYFTDYYTLATYPIVDEGKLYDIDSSGYYLGEIKGKKAWKKTRTGDWYYFNEDGTLNQEAKLEINNVTYYFDGNGVMVSDMFWYDEDTGEEYYINASGVRTDLKNGWKKIDGSWYYYKNGEQQTGLQTIDGKQYYLDPEMRTGYVWVTELNGYRFFGSNGAMTEVKTGWYSVKENYGTFWYYFVNGNPAEGLKTIGGKAYYFNNGRMHTGLFYTGVEFYLFDGSGAMVKGGWAKVDGYWYYASSNGRLYTGERTINGKKYWFTGSGIWVK